MKPRVREFADQNVAVAAVSTESLPELRDSLDKSELLGDIPFPLFSNADWSVFKEYRAFDDFENTPLHGAFLIDGNGFVLWQDIGYEPFTNVDFLLKESRRLLAATQSVDLAMNEDKRPDLGLRERVETVFEEAKELRRLIDEVRILRRSAPD